MFCITYSFQTNPNNHQQFEQAWLSLTQLIYQNAGSLGSRLHKVSENHYFAYAQWPSREAFEKEHNLPSEANVFSAQMKAACSKIEIVSKGEVVSDFIQREPFV